MSVNASASAEEQKEKIAQEKLEDELGPGVENPPKIPPAPELEIPKTTLTEVFDVKSIVDEIVRLPDTKKVDESIDKYTKHHAAARKVWIIKQAENVEFVCRMRVGDKDGERWIWKRDKDGKVMTENKRFFYTPLSIQEKGILFKKRKDKQSAEYDVALEGQKLTKLAKRSEEFPEDEVFTKKAWVDISEKFFIANQEYYLESFRSYFGATEDDIARLFFDDIVNYVDVAEHIEGVKSPSSGVL